MTMDFCQTQKTPELLIYHRHFWTRQKKCNRQKQLKRQKIKNLNKAVYKKLYHGGDSENKNTNG